MELISFEMERFLFKAFSISFDVSSSVVSLKLFNELILSIFISYPITLYFLKALLKRVGLHNQGQLLLFFYFYS